MTDVLAYPLAAITFLTGITVDVSTAAVVGIIAALIAAYPSARLVGANRKKVLAEAGQVADARVLAFAERVQEDNDALRAELAALRERCGRLEQVLREHGWTLPEQA